MIYSGMPPKDYKERFQEKILKIIEHSIFVREVTGSWGEGRLDCLIVVILSA